MVHAFFPDGATTSAQYAFRVKKYKNLVLSTSKPQKLNLTCSAKMSRKSEVECCLPHDK